MDQERTIMSLEQVQVLACGLTKYGDYSPEVRYRQILALCHTVEELAKALTAIRVHGAFYRKAGSQMRCELCGGYDWTVNDVRHANHCPLAIPLLAQLDRKE